MIDEFSLCHSGCLLPKLHPYWEASPKKEEMEEEESDTEMLQRDMVAVSMWWRAVAYDCIETRSFCLYSCLKPSILEVLQAPLHPPSNTHYTFHHIVPDTCLSLSHIPGLPEDELPSSCSLHPGSGVPLGVGAAAPPAAGGAHPHE